MYFLSQSLWFQLILIKIGSDLKLPVYCQHWAGIYWSQIHTEGPEVDSGDHIFLQQAEFKAENKNNKEEDNLKWAKQKQLKHLFSHFKMLQSRREVKLFKCKSDANSRLVEHTDDRKHKHWTTAHCHTLSGFTWKHWNYRRQLL